jgi:hypothetical protein
MSLARTLGNCLQATAAAPFQLCRCTAQDTERLIA